MSRGRAHAWRARGWTAARDERPPSRRLALSEAAWGRIAAPVPKASRPVAGGAVPLARATGLRQRHLPGRVAGSAVVHGLLLLLLLLLAAREKLPAEGGSAPGISMVFAPAATPAGPPASHPGPPPTPTTRPAARPAAPPKARTQAPPATPKPPPTPPVPLPVPVPVPVPPRLPAPPVPAPAAPVPPPRAPAPPQPPVTPTPAIPAPAVPVPPPQIHLDLAPEPAPPLAMPELAPLPLPTPVKPIPRAAAPSRASPFAAPLDLSLARPPPGEVPRAHGGGHGGVDLSLGPTVQNGRIGRSFARVTSAGASGDWQSEVYRWIQRHLYYPESARMAGEDGTVEVVATVDRNGHVLDVTLKMGSGSDALDTAALGMFRGATLPPFPDDMKGATAPVDLTINYILVR